MNKAEIKWIEYVEEKLPFKWDEAIHKFRWNIVYNDEGGIVADQYLLGWQIEFAREQGYDLISATRQ